MLLWSQPQQSTHILLLSAHAWLQKLQGTDRTFSRVIILNDFKTDLNWLQAFGFSPLCVEINGWYGQ